MLTEAKYEGDETFALKFTPGDIETVDDARAAEDAGVMVFTVSNVRCKSR